MSTASAQLLDKFLISFVERWLLTSLVVVCLVTSTGGGETGSPPPKSGGFISDGRGYFGGRGTAHRPLPHILEVAFLLVSEDFGGGRTGLPPHTVGVYFMCMVEDNDELNILYSLTYRAVTVEGDQHIVTSAVRQSNELYQVWTFGEPSKVMQSSAIHTVFLSDDLEAYCKSQCGNAGIHVRYRLPCAASHFLRNLRHNRLCHCRVVIEENVLGHCTEMRNSAKMFWLRQTFLH